MLLVIERLKNRILVSCVFCVLVVLVSLKSGAQNVIWQENFSYSDGTNSGIGTPAGITSWTADGYNGASGITVYNNELAASRSNNGNRDTWETTSPIDISEYKDVEVSIDLSGEGPMEDDDYVQVSYNLDNAGWQEFSTNGYQVNNGWGNHIAIQTGLNGNSLHLRIIMRNTQDTEFYYADNIVVRGTITCGDFGDPSTFGDNQWNVYAYNGNNLDLSGITYRGYYVETDLSFNTQTRWGTQDSPSYASGYQGCDVTVDNHTFVHKRTNFACGKYQIDVPSHDDQARLFVDGVAVWEHLGCCDSHTNVWTGYLDNASEVEFRVEEEGGGSYGALTFTDVTPTLSANFSANTTSILAGGNVIFTNSSSGEPVTYSWSFPGGTPSTSTEVSPTVTYNTAGTYAVSQTVSNECDESVTETKTNYITVTSPPPTVSLSIDNATIDESGGEAIVTATLSNTYNQNVIVYLNYGGTAAHPNDYNSPTYSITISPGSLTGTVTLTATEDCVVDEDETIIVDIGSVQNGAEDGVQEVTTTIIDNDFYPTITLSADNLSISENGGISIVTATLSNTFCQDITIYFNYEGNATHPNDYTYSSSSVTIPTGSLSGSITVSSANDYIVETDELISVVVSSTNILGIPTDVTPVDITIVDDDSYTITVSPSSGLITTEDGGTATFTVVLNAITYNNVTINLTSGDLSEGTVSPSNLTFTNGNYNIPQTVIITGVDDGVFDGDVNYTIITSSATSSDGNYDGYNPVDVSVTNSDNETINGDVWLRADVGTNTTTNGAAVTNWADQIGINNATSQGTAPTYDLLGWNFNPKINFTAGYYHTVTNGAADDMTLVGVFGTTQTTGSTSFWQTPAIIGCEASGATNDYTLSTNSGRIYFKGTEGDGFDAETAGTYNDGIPRIVVGTREKSSTGQILIYVNGVQVASAASDNTSLSSPQVLGIGNHNSPTSGGQFVGGIAEIFVDESVFSEMDRHQFETYLALKYGITLGSISLPIDYLNSAGTVIWNGSATYQSDVAGLGREASIYNLDQKISTSVNNAEGTSSRVVIAMDNDFSSGNLTVRTSLNEGQYLIWGNNHNNTGSWIVNGDYDHVSRNWRVQNTNGVGQVNVQIDLSGYPVLPTGKTYQLLVDTDEDLANGGVTIYDLTNTSGALYSGVVAFPAGTSFFTIGYESIIPVEIGCPEDQNENLDSNCELSLPDYTSQATVTGGAGTVTVTQSPIVGSTISSNTTVTLTATDEDGESADCSFTVNVTDDIDPQIINCPSNISAISTDGNPVIVNWTAPTASDNCSVNLTSDHNSGDSFPVGTTAVTYTATDVAGNTSTCSFNVIVGYSGSGTAPTPVFPSGYCLYKPITVAAAEMLSNYQVELSISYDSDMKADFSDLHFTLGDGTSLDYWIEDYSASSSATIWVEVPTLNTGDNFIYMFYGNSSATSESSISETMTQGLAVHYYTYPGGAGPAESEWTLVDGACVGVSDIIDHNWGSGFVDICSQTTSEQVVLRWNGWLVKPADAVNNISFRSGSDDGHRVWLNDNLVQDDWNLHSYSTTIYSVNLTEEIIPLQFDFFENGGDARVIFEWDPSGGNSFSTIPLSNYYHANYSETTPATSIGAEQEKEFNLDFTSFNSAVCPNQSASYTLTGSYDSYGWNIAGGSIVAGGSNSDNSVTVNWNGSGSSGSISLEVTSGSCSESITRYVTFVPDPIYTASDDTTICYGDEALLKVELGERSVYFDGNGDYIGIDDNNLVNTSQVTARTVSLWFKANSTGTRQVLYKEGASVNGFSIYIENGDVYFHAWESNDTWGAITAPVSSGVWNHVAFVFDESAISGEHFRGYLNGEYVGGINNLNGDDGMNSHSGDVNIAQSDGSLRYPDNGTDGGNYYFGGYIDEFKLWNEALTDDEILVASYQVSSTVSNSNLDVYYNFNDEIGPALTNITPENINGTLNGDATFVEDSPFNPSISWTPGGFNTFSINVAPTEETTYTYTLVEPNAGCQTTGTVTVNVSNIQLSASITDISCNGFSDGEIELSVSGGVSPYSFGWTSTDGSGYVTTDEDQTGITAGTYNVTVTDANDCTANGDYTVIEPLLYSLTIVSQSNPTTCGGNDGEIEFSLSNVPDGIYTISYDGGDFTGVSVSSEQATVSGLLQGTYNNLRITVGTCVTDTDPDVILSDPPLPTLSATGTNSSICGGVGTINFTFTNVPNGTYQIDYDEGSFTNVVVANNLATTSTVAGNYNNLSITINGCTSAEDVDLVVSDPPAPDLSNFDAQFSNGSDVCLGGTAAINVNSSSLLDGTYTVTYNLSSPNAATDEVVTMNFNSGTGSFSTIALSNTGATTLTITSVEANSCSSTTSIDVVIPVDVTEPSISCPAGNTVDCVKNMPVGATDYNSFVAAGGSASDNCTTQENLSITYQDVTDPGVNCKVTRTYTVTDDAGNSSTCDQIFTVTDNTSPQINCTSIEMETNSGCGAVYTVLAPDVSDFCSFGDIQPSYSYRLGNDSGNTEITGFGDVNNETFPLGTTTITWSIEDECGNSSSCDQVVSVIFPITPIDYDDGAGTSSPGSGLQPLQTSTHTYYIDSKSSETEYSYSWELYTDDNGNGTIDGGDVVVNSSLYQVNNSTSPYNPAFVSMTFPENLPTGTYLISVIKTKISSSCQKQETLSVTIQTNDLFDVELLPFGDHCQAGETGTPSTITWEISFPSVATEPFMFDYTITIDGNSVCSGTVSDISYLSSSLTEISGCPVESPVVLPYAQISKSAGTRIVTLEYTIESTSGVDYQIGITIDATDTYEVSEPNITNNTETLNANGVPNTSAITTD